MATSKGREHARKQKQKQITRATRSKDRLMKITLVDWAQSQSTKAQVVSHLEMDTSTPILQCRTLTRQDIGARMKAWGQEGSSMSRIGDRDLILTRRLLVDQA
jgi:hypothetical protein